MSLGLSGNRLYVVNRGNALQGREATVAGNVLVQAIAAGRFADLTGARAFVEEKVSLKEFAPRNGEKIEAARRRYEAVEAKRKNCRD